MISRTALGGCVLSAVIMTSSVGLASAQQRAQPATQISSANPQIQMRDPQVRTRLVSNLSGISVDAVMAMAEGASRPGSNERAREVQSQRDGVDRAVSRAEIGTLIRLPARAGTESAPGNILPPPRVRPGRAVPPAPSDRAIQAPERTVPPRAPTPSGGTSLAAPPQPYLDVNGFGEDLHNALRNSVQGYTMRMRRNGQNIYTLQWNWARRPADGGRGWNPDRRMNIASVSKFVTAVAMVDLLDRRNIDPKTSIAQWLPAYWSRGANVNNITFEMLMTHSSGFNNSGSTAFATMRQMVASGVTANLPTSFTYENTNFGLQRILIATLGGYVNRNMDMGNVGLNDAMWDAATRAAYADYVSKNVFAPAGIANAGFDKTANTALAYSISGGAAWNSGDLSWRAGSGGWHLSVDEILDVAAAYLYSGKIVSTSRASSSIGKMYGFDGRWNTPAGLVYHKNGSWREQADCPVGQRQEQSLLLVMPGNMEMALLVNSPVGPSCTFLRGIVQQIYMDNIVVPNG